MSEAKISKNKWFIEKTGDWMKSKNLRAAFALTGMLFVGLLLIHLFPWTSEQDSEYHFSACLQAWHNALLFLDPWARPLHVLVFVIPAHIGWNFTRHFALALGILVGWQTWKLAVDLCLVRAWSVIPILLGQPVFLVLYPDFLTEPLFALVLVIALRWHLLGWTKRGILLASFLPLARPEGFFICLLWSLWLFHLALIAQKTRGWSSFLKILAAGLLLLTGTTLWWLAALLLSGDPLFIPHHWPSIWSNGMMGHATLFTYTRISWEYIGPLFLPFFMLGFLANFWKPNWREVAMTFLLPFTLHSIFQAYNLLGEAGLARYMVSVSPVTAVITLAGWNIMCDTCKFSGWKESLSKIILLSISMIVSAFNFDSKEGGRDEVAIRDMSQWIKLHHIAYKNLVWSNAYMCVLLGGPANKNISLEMGKKSSNLEKLLNMDPGTLVFWDNHLGQGWYRLSPAEIESAGYERLLTNNYHLQNVFQGPWTGIIGNSRETEISLLYKR